MTSTEVRSPRMSLLLGSAVHVVAEHGLRGLTHRAVDRQAGLPEGSCSAYLRTREALVDGVTAYVAERVTANCHELADELAATSHDDAQAAATVTRAILRWVDEREILVTRLELTIQASREPRIAATMTALRQELVGVVAGILTTRGTAGAAAAAETLVASIDGILIGAMLRPPGQRKTFVRRAMDVLMAGLG
jgi:DNA-binding transcriptional regulator YbjK